MKALERIRKQYADRLEEVHTEDDGCLRNGAVMYWATLKPGWISNLECRLIHEPTIKTLEQEIKSSINRKN